MNERLCAIYRCISPGRGVIDVGTDHGYIPVRLAEEGYPGRILASDINSGPLDAARRTAESRAVSERISFLLCDGLDACPPEAVDTIVIAGMGGDTICAILDRAEWCMSPAYRLILQPMTKQEVLRYWLVNNGFRLEEETLVKDKGILYQVIAARFCDENTRLSDAELFTGSYLNVSRQPLFGELLDSELRRFQNSLDGQRGAGEGKDGGRLGLTEGIVKELSGMKERLYE